MEETVKDIISRQLAVDADEISDDMDIVDDLGADSLDVVEMLMAVEEYLDLVVPDEDVIGLKTVHDVISYVEAHA